jgi:tRNA A-37 threonylcarbamoyl transferase component Bud32
VTPAPRWRAGGREAQQVVEAWLAGGATGAHELRDNPRRRLVRLDTASGAAGALLVKQFRAASGRHRLRERVKAWLGRAPAVREWRALVALHAAGAPVPEPLALGFLRDGDPLLVLRFVDGRPLADALRDARGPERRALAHALGRSVAALHAAGFLHGDLHHGNVLVTPDGVAVLLDLQHASRGAGPDARMRDLGFLDYALAGIGLSAANRLRVARAALGITGAADGAGRAALRAVARAHAARADEHARSRTRRTLRPGRAFARFAHAGARGVRVRDVPAEALAAALEASAAASRARGAAGVAVLKADRRSLVCRVATGGSSVIVKSVSARGLGRPLADLFRGSAARRAWIGGHGLRVRGIGAARPLAFLEQRRLGLPIASQIVLEDLAPAVPADEAAAWSEPERDALLDSLGALAATLHRRRVVHGDLKASHVLVPRGVRGAAPALIDLEGVRFPRRALRVEERLHALAQLNASLSDDFGAAARCRAFARYVRAAPFPGPDGAKRALEEIVRRSLARRHRWSGAGCERARLRAGLSPDAP